MGDAIEKLSLGLILFVSLGLSKAFADTDAKSQVIGPFGTLNNYDSSIVIPDNKSSDLLNVDITPGGRSVKKRFGFATAFTLGITTSPTHGVYRFYDASGNEVFLFANDTRLTSSINGGSPTVLYSTGPNAATYQCVDYAGQAYCANTNRNNIIQTNGNTYSALTGLVSTGTMVAVTSDRLVEAGFSEAPNRIDFSASALFTSWNQPFLLPTDPNEITVVAPGSKITHIVYAFQRLMWFKDSSFGYILFDNSSLSNWQVRTVSSNVGTNDNSSIYWQDVLYFRGQDGHFYSYDGSTLQRMSRDITASINQAQTKRSNQWSQTSQSDFQSGSLTSLDATSSPGNLQLSLGTETPFVTKYGTDALNIDCSLSAWGSPYYASLRIVSTDTFVLSSVTLRLTKRKNPGTFTISILSDSSNTPGTTLSSLTFDPTSVSTSAAVDINIPLTTTVPLSSGTTYWVQMKANGTCDGTNNVGWWLDNTSPTACYQGSTLYVSGCPKAQLLGKKYSSSGTYLSAVDNAANLSTWDSFQTNKSDNGGTHTFSIRAATNSFTVASSTPSWTTIISGNTPTISTGTYLQIRDVFSTPVSSQTPVLNDFTQYWFEGSAADKTYGQYFDYALWWNVQLGAGSTYNNYTLKYDMINQGWTVYDIPMDGMYVRSNSLYFGSSVGGYVYKYGTVNNDNGSAINAYWKSKDFFGDSPFTVKTFPEISAAATSVLNSTVTLTLTADSLYVSTDTWYLYNPNSPFIKYINSQPLNTIGTTFNLKFGNNAADQPFEVFAGEVQYRPKPTKNTKQ